MLFIVEIFLFIYGIIALVKKEWSIGGGKKVVGGPAMLLGLISLLVLPAILVLSVGFGFIWGMTKGVDNFPTIAVALFEFAFVIGAAVLLVVLGKKSYAKQEALRAEQAATGAQAPQDPLPPA